MAKVSDDLRVRAAELRADAARKDDKSAIVVASVALICVIGTFATVITLASWYVENSMGGENASVQVKAVIVAMYVAAVVAAGLLALSGWYLVAAGLTRKAALVQIRAADQMDQDQAEKDRAKEIARSAAEAGAKLAEQYKAAQAERVAKAVQDTRDELRTQQGRPSVEQQRNSERGNNPGGTSGKGKGR